MDLREALEKYKRFKIPSLSTICEKASQYSKTCLFLTIILFSVFVYLIQQVPHWQVATFEINNSTEIAQLENSYRATLAQALGGVAIGIGLYYTWRRISIAEEDLKATQENLKIAQENLKVTQQNLATTQKIAQENLKIAQEGQITERFTRAIDQLGNSAIEIRVGGIYALQRISNESVKDYWSIIQTLTSFIRQKSPYPKYIDVEDSDKELCGEMTSYEFFEYLNEKPESEIIASFVMNNARKLEVPLDVQTAVYVIKERRFFNAAFKDLKNPFSHANVEPDFLSLYGTDLFCVDLEDAHLEGAALSACFLCMANLNGSCLQNAYLRETILQSAKLEEANLEETCFAKANLKNAYLKHAHLKGTNLEGANLMGAKNLTVEQLSKVKTLYNAKLDPELEEELRARGFGKLLDDEPKR